MPSSNQASQRSRPLRRSSLTGRRGPPSRSPRGVAPARQGYRLVNAARSPLLPPETLTRRFAQNKSDPMELVAYRLISTPALFHLNTHRSVRGTHQSRRRLITVDFAVNGGFSRDRLARKSLFPRRNRTASRTIRAPAIPVPNELTGRILRGRKE
jgi:hypothetical protein